MFLAAISTPSQLSLGPAERSIPKFLFLGVVGAALAVFTDYMDGGDATKGEDKL